MIKFRSLLLSITVATSIAVSGASLAAAKIGVIGAANPLLLVISEEGIERELLAGDVVFLNDTIKTSESGSAQLMFLDRTAMTIAPNAEVKIDKFVFNPETQDGQMEINVASGAFRLIGGALSKKKPINVKTPISTMGIRGGIMDGSVGENGASTGSFVHGEQMSMTDASGNTVTTDKPGSGLGMDDAKSPPKRFSSSQMKQRFPESPVKPAFKVSPPAPKAQIDQINNQMDMKTPDTPPATNPDEPKEDVLKDEKKPEPSEEPKAQEPNEEPKPQEPVEDGAKEDQNKKEADPTQEAAKEDGSKKQAPKENGNKPVVKDPLSDSEMREIRTNPQSVLDKFPEGGTEMAKHIAKAIAVDPSLVDSLSDVAEKATPAQAAAMGAGMARAGRMWNAVNPDAAKDIIENVNKIPNPRVNRTFNAIGPKSDGIGDFVAPRPLPTPPLSNSPVGTKASKLVSEAISQQQPADIFLQPKLTSPVNQVKFNTKPKVSEVIESGSAVGAAVTTFVAEDAVENDALPTSPSK